MKCLKNQFKGLYWRHMLVTVGMDLYRDMQRERMPEKLTEGEAAV